MNLKALADALRAAADALEAETSAAPAPAAIEAPAAPKAARKPKAAAPESAPPVAPAAAPASAPAAPAPEPAPVAPTYPDFGLVKKPLLKLAGINREAAVKILAGFGVANASQLKPEQYQAAIDALEVETDRLEAAAAQASLV